MEPLIDYGLVAVFFLGVLGATFLVARHPHDNEPLEFDAAPANQQAEQNEQGDTSTASPTTQD